jgi:uncharacterized protein (DUF1499 family)
MPLFSIRGTRPSNLGVHDGRLAECPSSPNCVASDAGDDAHAVAPFRISAPAAHVWEAVRENVAALPRTTVVVDTGEYLHAECSSALLGFVDDLELHLRPVDGIIAVRSASRVGYSDLGVNAGRVEDLRHSLELAGVIK